MIRLRRPRIFQRHRQQRLDLQVLRCVDQMLTAAPGSSVKSRAIADELTLPLDVVHDSLERLAADGCIDARFTRSG